MFWMFVIACEIRQNRLFKCEVCGIYYCVKSNKRLLGREVQSSRLKVSCGYCAAQDTRKCLFHSPCALYSFSPRALVCPLEMIPVSQATCASRVSRMFWWRKNIRHVECSRKLNLHHRIGYFETFRRSSNAEII